MSRLDHWPWNDRQSAGMKARDKIRILFILNYPLQIFESRDIKSRTRNLKFARKSFGLKWIDFLNPDLSLTLWQSHLCPNQQHPWKGGDMANGCQNEPYLNNDHKCWLKESRVRGRIKDRGRWLKRLEQVGYVSRKCEIVSEENLRMSSDFMTLKRWTFRTRLEIAVLKSTSNVSSWAERSMLCTPEYKWEIAKKWSRVSPTLKIKSNDQCSICGCYRQPNTL